MENFEYESDLTVCFLYYESASLQVAHTGSSSYSNRIPSGNNEIRIWLEAIVHFRIIDQLIVRVEPACIICVTAHKVCEIVCRVVADFGAAISVLRMTWSAEISFGAAHSLLVIEGAILTV